MFEEGDDVTCFSLIKLPILIFFYVFLVELKITLSYGNSPKISY